MDNQVIVLDYILKWIEYYERSDYILGICKKIKKAGCNVLFIQKFILRDAVNDLALHFLAKMKVLAVKDMEREDIEIITKTIRCRPIASLDHFLAERLGQADLVDEVSMGTEKVVKVTGVQVVSVHSAILVVRARALKN